MICSKILTFELPDGKVLLVNALSGAVDLVNSETANKLLSEKLPPAEQVVWKKRGYILSDLTDEEKIQSRIVSSLQRALSHSPLLAVIIPNYTCNLRCTYCFEGSLVESKARMPLDIIPHLFVAIQELAKRHANTLITLYGGEPLLRSNQRIITSILQKARENNIQIYSIITNGVTLAYWSPILSKYDVKHIQVTIDGIEEIHNARRPFAGGEGSFDKVVQGIDAALQYGLNVVARTNVDLGNVSRLPSLAEFYLKRKWSDHPRFTPYLSIVNKPSCMGSDLCSGGDPEIIGKVIKIIDSNWELFNKWKLKFDRVGHIVSVLSEGKSLSPRAWYCSAGKNMFVFDPQGKIYPCWEHVGTDQEIGYYLPSLTFNESAFLWAERTIETIPSCRHCSMNLLCGGGCPYHAQQQYGTIQAPACYKPKETLDQIVPFLYTRLYRERVQK